MHAMLDLRGNIPAFLYITDGKAHDVKSPNAVKTQIWIAMVVYLMVAILKERYHLDLAMSKLLHFLEVNLFEQKSLLSIFQINPRYERNDEDKQLKLFDF